MGRRHARAMPRERSADVGRERDFRHRRPFDRLRSPRAESRGDRKLRFAGYYKLPVAQTDQENCVAHNGSLIPVPGRDIMVQAWYQGGVSIFDFTDAAKPFEIAYFDRGPLAADRLITGGHWSAYWYNGHIYATEIARGLDVFRLRPSAHLSQNEINAAMLAYVDDFNPQQQRRVTWPAMVVVPRAHVDQLVRSKAIDPQRATSIRTALNRAMSFEPVRRETRVPCSMSSIGLRRSSRLMRQARPWPAMPRACGRWQAA